MAGEPVIGHGRGIRSWKEAPLNVGALPLGLEMPRNAQGDIKAKLAEAEKLAAIYVDLAEWWETAALYLAEFYDVPNELMVEALDARPVAELFAHLNLDDESGTV